MFEIISSEESVERAQEILENIESCCELTDNNELWYDIAQQCVTEGFEGLDREQVRMTYGAFESVVEAVRFNCGKNAADGLLKATVASFNEYIEYKNTIAERYDAEDNAYIEAITMRDTFKECLEAVYELQEDMIEGDTE